MQLPTPGRNATGEADLRALDRMRSFDRTATLEHVTAYLAHELGSPLNVIEGRAAILLATASCDDEVRRNVRIIAEQSARMAQLLRNVVGFCRRPGNGTTTVDLIQLVRSAVALFDRVALDRHVTITLDDGDTAESIQGDPDALLVLLSHLLENGLDSTPPGGTLRIRLSQCSLTSAESDEPCGDELRIDVDDDGPEIEADVIRALFKPFTTTHGTREASGIGLFIAQAIAKDHGGWIEGAKKPTTGARFTLHLPRGASHAQ